VQNNPAARLYNLARRLRSTASGGPPARLWAQALDIPIDQQLRGPLFVDVVEGIIAFLKLVKETETGLEELEFDDFYAAAFPPLKLVAQVSLSNLRANQSHLTRPITDETLTLLRVIAAEWEKKKPDPKINEEVLKKIQAQAHRLFEAIKGAKIDGDLKRLILLLTSEIEQAIQQFRISGPEGLNRALALIIGEANLKIGMIAKAQANARTRIWWSRFWKVAVNFSKVVSLANDTRKTIEAISPIVRLVGGAPDGIPPIDLGGPGK